ncbi:hypothetical protein D3C87_1294790 [compost metagenome]
MCIAPEATLVHLAKLLAADAEQALQLRVAVAQAAIIATDQHGHRTAVQYCTQLRFAGFECRLHLPSLADIANRSADTGASPLQKRQVRQADLHGKLAAILAKAFEVIQFRAHLPGAAMGDEAIAQRYMPAARRVRHQPLDGLAHQLTRGITEQRVQLRVGHQDFALGIDDDHAVRCRLEDRAIPGLGGTQRSLLCLQFLRLQLKPQGLLTHFVGLAPGLDQQGLHRQMTLHHRQGPGQAWHGLLQQRLFTGPQRLMTRQFEHAEQTFTTQYRLHQQIAGRHFTQLRMQPSERLRQPLQFTGRTIQGALP